MREYSENRYHMMKFETWYQENMTFEEVAQFRRFVEMTSNSRNFSELKYWLHRKILGESRDFVSGEHEIRRGGTISTILGNDVKFQEFLGTEILATS